jgi:hypothetical protein
LFLLLDDSFLLSDPAVNLGLSLSLLASHEFIPLHLSYTLLLLDHVVLDRILLVLLLVENILPLPVLRLHVLLLFSLLLLA